METQIGEALKASKKRKSQLVTSCKPNGDRKFIDIKHKNIWKHIKGETKEEYIPDFQPTKASIRIGAAFLAFVALNVGTNDAQMTTSIKNFHRVIETSYESIELGFK